MVDKRLPLIIMIMLLSLAAVRCSTDSDTDNEPQPTTINVNWQVSGSGGTTPIIAALNGQFSAANEGYTLVTLTGTGTGGGITGILEGVLDIASMGRPPTEEEATQIEFFSFGFGAEVPFTHADVGITDLTSQQLIDIFSGEITNWSEIGGDDLPIVIFVRSDTSTHTVAIRDAIFGDVPFIDNAVVMGGMGDMITNVESVRGSIGYVNWPTAVALAADVTPITVDGLSPTDPNYPAQLEIGIAYLPDRKAEFAPLLDWLASEEGQTSLRNFGVLAQ